MLDADLQVLPERAAGHSVEVAHDDEEPNIAGLRGLLEGGHDDVAVVLGGDLPGRLESDHACGSPLSAVIIEVSTGTLLISRTKL